MHGLLTGGGDVVTTTVYTSTRTELLFAWGVCRIWANKWLYDDAAVDFTAVARQQSVF